MNKYRNTKVITQDGVFGSKREYRRYLDLLLLQRAWKISRLETQVPYRLEVNGYLICKYVADFTYTASMFLVVEDVKSPITRKNPVYRLKKKLMKAIHGIDILET